jgi:hypothetical protein
MRPIENKGQNDKTQQTFPRTHEKFSKTDHELGHKQLQ